MQNQFSRTEMLLGRPAIDTLKGSRVAVFGVGGVGGYVVEVLARSGVGAIDIIDNDTVCITNVNRQLLTTTKNVGKNKVDVAEERIHDINPDCIVRKYQTFYLPETADQFDFSVYDYVVDCIDTVKAKIDLVYRCHEVKTPLLSCMGAAFKLDPTQFRVTDLFKTINDPLAKVIRKKLRKSNIKHLKVIYSPEEPLTSIEFPEESTIGTGTTEDNSTRSVPSSNAWVPAAAGLIAGGEVVKDLIKAADTMRIRPEDEATSEPARIAHERAAKMLEEHKRLKAEKAVVLK
jgi:thiF family protein